VNKFTLDDFLKIDILVTKKIGLEKYHLSIKQIAAVF